MDDTLNLNKTITTEITYKIEGWSISGDCKDIEVDIFYITICDNKDIKLAKSRGSIKKSFKHIDEAVAFIKDRI